MLLVLRRHRFLRLFWGLMAAYLLNISVDVPDATQPHMPENLAFNDIESVAEFFLEEILCIENAVPEHDDPDGNTEQENVVKKSLTLFFATTSFLINRTALSEGLSRLPLHIGAKYSNYTPAIISPPPEV